MSKAPRAIRLDPQDGSSDDTVFGERSDVAVVPEVEPIATADYPTPARRPAYSCLDTTRLRADFGVALPDWRAALGGVLDAMRA